MKFHPQLFKKNIYSSWRSRDSLCKMAESWTRRILKQLILLFFFFYYKLLWNFSFLFSFLFNERHLPVPQITRDLALPRFSWQNVIKVPLIRRERSCSFGETDELRHDRRNGKPRWTMRLEINLFNRLE